MEEGCPTKLVNGAMIDFKLLGNSMTLLDNDIICVVFAGHVELLVMRGAV